MNQPRFSSSERRQLIDRYIKLDHDLSGPHNKAFTMPEKKAMSKERDALLQQYADNLPLVPLSTCPFCVAVLEYPLDIVGLDGMWWEKGPLADYPSPKGCEHFRVLLGAIDFKSLQPAEAKTNDDVYAGPGVPYVVPRMLEEIPSMKAVISSFTMPPGYVCHVIAYFSQNPVHGSLLHQPWGREAYQVLNEKGEYEGWFAANDKIDFELQPWIDKGELLWIKPGDAALTLQTRPPCPYVNLPGVRLPQRIIRGKLETRPLPTGEKFQPFE